MPRSISMKDFRDPASALEAQRLYLACQADPTIANTGVPLGQIVGHVTGVEKKLGTLPDGSQKESTVCYGKFNAVVYKTGQIFENVTQAYLPGYFADDVARTFNSKSNDGADILFGVEVYVIGTGKSIPIAYEVKDQAGLNRSKPLENLMRMMASKGVLRLPPPAAPEPEALTAPQAGPADITDATVTDLADDAETGLTSDDGADAARAQTEEAATVSAGKGKGGSKRAA